MILIRIDLGSKLGLGHYIRVITSIKSLLEFNAGL